MYLILLPFIRLKPKSSGKCFITSLGIIIIFIVTLYQELYLYGTCYWLLNCYFNTLYCWQIDVRKLINCKLRLPLLYPTLYYTLLQEFLALTSGIYVLIVFFKAGIRRVAASVAFHIMRRHMIAVWIIRLYLEALIV